MMKINSLRLRIYLSIAISFAVSVVSFLGLHLLFKKIQVEYIYDVDVYNMFTTAYFLISVVLFVIILHQLIMHRINYIQRLSLELSVNNTELTVIGNDEISTLAKCVNQARFEIAREYADKQQIIAGLSHDLRTPLTSMVGYIDLLSNSDNLTAQQREYLFVVKNKTEYLSNLQTSLFEYIKISGSDYSVNNQLIDVSLVLKQCIIESFTLFKKKDLEIRYDNIIPCELECDTMILARIFENLISNGYKYANSYFKVSSTCNDGFYSIIFRNDIEKEIDTTKIFKRFYTGDSSRHNGSSGLGLAIVQAAVEKLKGQINITVVNGTFSVEIKLYS
ncbi:MAG: sensor histidine kinase [Bacteroidales bacterium]